jgi:hypothetical protein
MERKPILVEGPARSASTSDEVPEGLRQPVSLDGSGFHAARYVDDDDRGRRLARLIAAGHTDIRIHLERVNRCVELDDRDGVYGALVDLFIATGPANTGIRSRALLWADPLLDDTRAAALRSAVDVGLAPGDPVPLAACSVLSRGVTGHTHLVVRDRPAPTAGVGSGRLLPVRRPVGGG